MSTDNTDCVSVHFFAPCGTSSGVQILLPHFDAMCNKSGSLKTSIHLIIFETIMGY